MINIIKNKKVPFWGIISGILIIIIGFIYDLIFAGIPYQDPTPAMTQKYNFHSSVAEIIELIGLSIMMISIVGTVLRKFSRQNKIINSD